MGHTPWWISILADFRPMGYSFHAIIVFGVGKNLLFKYVLGHCGLPPISTVNLFLNYILSNTCRAAYGGRMPAVLDENLQLKICRADMHGCLMKVTRALNSCLIGIQGNLLRDIDKKTVK